MKAALAAAFALLFSSDSAAQQPIDLSPAVEELRKLPLVRWSADAAIRKIR